MSSLLDQAFAEIRKLTDAEQEEVAAWILAELEDDRRWSDSFAKSTEKLKELAAKATTQLSHRSADIENPWRKLPIESPFVLRSDEPAIKKHNVKFKNRSPFKIQTTQVIPEPYVGNVATAKVLILLLNPGYDYRNRKSHSDPAFRAALLKNLRHEKTEWPFYFFNPDFCDKLHPGCDWWLRKTKKLRQHVCIEQLSQKLAVVEWFPYKSTQFKSGCKVPSQQYSFELVRQAMSRDAVLIIRSKTRWLKTIPELNTYKNALEFSSQNAAITPNNLCVINDSQIDPWDLLLSAFKE